MTQQRFGKVIRLFAPLYLSNECINNCTYCGFRATTRFCASRSRWTKCGARRRRLKAQGFRNLLLVAGEHPKFVSNNYLRDCIAALHADWPGISLEVGPMETEEYRPLVAAGADGLVVYQETYDRKVYAEMHTAGPKRNFDWRLETPERAYAAGFRRLGISPLYGLADWRHEAIERGGARGLSAAQLLEGALTISLCGCARARANSSRSRTSRPRTGATHLRAAPDVSRRGHRAFHARTPKLRDGLMPLGVTMMSAGSAHRAGRLHRRGQGKNPSHRARHHQGTGVRRQRMGAAGGPRDQRDRPVQHRRRTFRRRSGGTIRKLGYEPVWKDWDAALTA
jgi:2-iminoacetate synthase